MDTKARFKFLNCIPHTCFGKWSWLGALGFLLVFQLTIDLSPCRLGEFDGSHIEKVLKTLVAPWIKGCMRHLLTWMKKLHNHPHHIHRLVVHCLPVWFPSGALSRCFTTVLWKRIDIKEDALTSICFIICGFSSKCPSHQTNHSIQRLGFSMMFFILVLKEVWCGS